MAQNGIEPIFGVFKAFSKGIQNYPIVKLTKLKSTENPKYDNVHPRNIKNGYTVEGKMLRPVTVGQSFYVNHLNEKNHFHTSVVQEILSKNTFSTMNSIYKWEII